MFNVAEKIFSPSEDDDSLDVSDVIVECEEGMKSQNTSMCSKNYLSSFIFRIFTNYIHKAIEYYPPTGDLLDFPF